MLFFARSGGADGALGAVEGRGVGAGALDGRATVLAAALATAPAPGGGGGGPFPDVIGTTVMGGSGGGFFACWVCKPGGGRAGPDLMAVGLTLGGSRLPLLFDRGLGGTDTGRAIPASGADGCGSSFFGSGFFVPACVYGPRLGTLLIGPLGGSTGCAMFSSGGSSFFTLPSFFLVSVFVPSYGFRLGERPRLSSFGGGGSICGGACWAAAAAAACAAAACAAACLCASSSIDLCLSSASCCLCICAMRCIASARRLFNA